MMLRVVDKPPTLEALPSRELEGAHWAGKGKTNKPIAAGLKICERTVKAHLTSISQKLAIHHRLQLALIMQQDPDANARPATIANASPTR